MKITDKESLCKYLKENSVDDDRMKVFSTVIQIQSNDDFNKKMKECARSMMFYEEASEDTSAFLWYDYNLHSLVKKLYSWSDVNILKSFGSRYNSATISVNEDGEGLVFFGCLY